MLTPLFQIGAQLGLSNMASLLPCYPDRGPQRLDPGYPPRQCSSVQDHGSGCDQVDAWSGLFRQPHGVWRPGPHARGHCEGDGLVPRADGKGEHKLAQRPPGRTQKNHRRAPQWCPPNIAEGGHVGSQRRVGDQRRGARVHVRAEAWGEFLGRSQEVGPGPQPQLPGHFVVALEVASSSACVGHWEGRLLEVGLWLRLVHQSHVRQLGAFRRT